jgi:hypothetical protein
MPASWSWSTVAQIAAGVVVAALVIGLVAGRR